MAKVVTSAMLLNAKAEVASLEVDNDFLKEKERQLKAETDEEIMTRLGQRVEILEDMTRACKKGDVGSQIPNIRNIRSAVQEACRFYVELAKEGATAADLRLAEWELELLMREPGESA